MAVNWCVISAAVPPWAARVFPEAPAADRVGLLWDAIFRMCRIDAGDPAAAWKEHIDRLERRRELLTEKAYTSLHYRAPGTELTVGLPQGHVWRGGIDRSDAGTLFVPNIPTEEVFTMPHCRRTGGRVRSTKPLNYGGSLIEDFSVTFAEGRIVEVAAAQGEDILRNLVETDDGAARLGEIALVPHSSPVSQFGRLILQHPVRRERLEPRRPRAGVQRLPGERRRHGGGGVLRRGREPQRRARRLHDRLWGDGNRRGAFRRHPGAGDEGRRVGRWRCRSVPDGRAAARMGGLARGRIRAEGRVGTGSVVAVGQAQLREQARQLGAGLRVEGNPLALALPALAMGALSRHEDLVEPGGLARGLEPGYQLLDRPPRRPRGTRNGQGRRLARTRR